MQRWNTMLLIAALTSLGAVGCDDETNTTNTDGGQDASTNDGNVDVDGDVNDGGTEDATVDAGPTAASLRVVHAYAYANIEIDVYLSPQGSDIPENAAPLAEDVAYGDVYANDGLAPGAYTLHFFQAGSDPSEEQAATYDVTLVAGELNTVVAALAAPGEPPAFLELGDVSAPTAGNASVVFVNALAGDESFTAYDLATIETPVELFMDFEFGDQEAASFAGGEIANIGFDAQGEGNFYLAFQTPAAVPAGTRVYAILVANYNEEEYQILLYAPGGNAVLATIPQLLIN